MNRVTRFFNWFMWDRFHLKDDAADPRESIEALNKSVEFKGTNLWILIFAIFIASIGLNLNSTAVVIGAMLISPLMGPIMGFGLGISINDFQLVKKALRNLAIAASIAICTSAIYFSISPIHDARSELLARISPTVYDVLIAFFGGLSGAIAGTRKEKSNVIPGMAIATALMPPLCTAGYGLATKQWNFFFGAFYLFVINSVFISLSTMLVVKYLRFPKVSYIDEAERIRVRAYIWIITLVTLLPSIYFGYREVQKNIYQKNARQFIEREMTFHEATLLRQKIDPSLRHIELLYVGITVPDSLLETRKKKLGAYKLNGTRISVRQFGITDSSRIEMLQSSLSESPATELTRANAARLQQLEQQLNVYQQQELDRKSLFEEARAIQPRIKKLALENLILQEAKQQTDTTLLVYLELSEKLSQSETKQLYNWLETRLKSKKLKIIEQLAQP